MGYRKPFWAECTHMWAKKLICIFMDPEKFEAVYQAS